MDGLPNLLNNKTGNLVHSKNDPKKEGFRFAERIFNDSISQQNNKVFICFGFGMGYHMDSLYEIIDKKTEMVCIEPIPSILSIPEVKKKSLK